MAVEAHHLHRLLPTTREVANAVESQPCYNDPYMGLVSLPSAVAPYASFCTPAAAAAGSDSGVTYGNATVQPMQEASRKRARLDEAAVLGETGVSTRLQQGLLDVDRLVLQHAENIRSELAERRRRYARQVMMLVAKRLKAKDEEIERMWRLNWALEERLKSMYVEAQVWRDLAQSNEAAANALRADLEKALEAQAHTADVDDAESCCGGGENGMQGGAEVASMGTVRGRCRGCGKAPADVLLLPCRHLCTCSPCAAAARTCPACGCPKNGSVPVNLV